MSTDFLMSVINDHAGAVAVLSGFTARQAFGAMRRQKRPALPTYPPSALLLNERLCAEAIDLSEVLDHAHPVLRAIALVELSQAFAGELRTIDTA